MLHEARAKDEAGVAERFTAACWKGYKNILSKHKRFHRLLLVVCSTIIAHLLDGT